ncbi:hypothetical protein BZA77DRAFT_328369 [Pyronema omphalodes]|nr:hypothetical protein BZA77DRAFT_328369 [Pyronema omphalodes]
MGVDLFFFLFYFFGFVDLGFRVLGTTGFFAPLDFCGLPREDAKRSFRFCTFYCLGLFSFLFFPLCIYQFTWLVSITTVAIWYSLKPP